jgi:hypothetical protein
MSEHAILYFLQRVPKLELLLEPPGHGGMVVSRASNGDADAVVTMVGPLRVELSLVAEDELRAHLDRFHAYLTRECEIADPALPDVLRTARGIVAVTVEPGFDPGGACERFLRNAVARTDGLLFLENGSLEDGKGGVLARARSAEGDEGEDGAEGGPQAPSRERVARRALAVAALTWRGWLEMERPAKAAEQIAASNEWLERHGVVEEMDPRERGLMRSAAGSCPVRPPLDRGWAIEGAAVLAWALGLYEVPPHDMKVLPPPLGGALGLFAAEPPALAAPLRPEAEIAAMAARLRGIHLRLSEFVRAPGAVDFVAFSRSAPSGPFDARGIALAEGDLAISGQPLSRTPENAVQAVLSTAVERHGAIAWLQGRSDPAATRS